MHPFVRQHRLTDDITHSKDMWHIGTHLLIDVNKAAFIHIHSRLFSLDQAAIGCAPYGHQHGIITDGGVGGFLAFKAHPDAILFGLNRGHFGFQHQVELIFHLAGIQLHHIFICRWDQLIHKLHHFDIGAEGVIHSTHLQTYDAAAQNQQLLRHQLQFQRVGRAPDAWVVMRDKGQLHRA